MLFRGTWYSLLVLVCLLKALAGATPIVLADITMDGVHANPGIMLRSQDAVDRNMDIEAAFPFRGPMGEPHCPGFLAFTPALCSNNGEAALAHLYKIRIYEGNATSGSVVPMPIASHVLNLTESNSSVHLPPCVFTGEAIELPQRPVFRVPLDSALLRPMFVYWISIQAVLNATTQDSGSTQNGVFWYIAYNTSANTGLTEASGIFRDVYNTFHQQWVTWQPITIFETTYFTAERTSQSLHHVAARLEFACAPVDSGSPTSGTPTPSVLVEATPSESSNVSTLPTHANSTSTSPPSTTSSPVSTSPTALPSPAFLNDTNSSGSETPGDVIAESKLSVTAIVLIMVGSAVVGVLLLVVIFIVVRFYRRKVRMRRGKTTLRETTNNGTGTAFFIPLGNVSRTIESEDKYTPTLSGARSDASVFLGREKSDDSSSGKRDKQEHSWIKAEDVFSDVALSSERRKTPTGSPRLVSDDEDNSKPGPNVTLINSDTPSDNSSDS